MKSCVIVLTWLSLVVPASAQESIDSAVARFYALRWGQPAWVFNSGPSRPAELLLDVAARARRDGLDSTAYLTPAVDALLRRHLSPEQSWELDSLLTRAFLLYGRDVSRGRVDPAAVDTQWTAASQPLDLIAALGWAADADDVGTWLRSIEPPQRGYRALRRALQRYREIAQRGPWPASVRERLGAEGYDTAAGLRTAVMQFQKLHGLAVDGVVGPATRAALDIPAAARAEQIALNLERWRWLPRELGERYIVVNSAAFTLELVDHDSIVWQARAIVGRLDWPTPIVSSVATGLSFRPTWKVPRIIAARELLPLIRKDSTYLRREQIRVFSDSAQSGALDPAAIDWLAVTESTFAYQLVQEPGGTNPLGGVKLVFRNRFSVFIHDTPTRRLFSDLWRTFSHGCIRVEHAGQLAGRLLPDWPVDSINAAMTRGRERWVALTRPIPVHIVYWTAWVTEDGLVAFSGDPYHWDDALARALTKRDAGQVTANTITLRRP